MAKKLTDVLIRKEPPKSKAVFIWDTLATGLGIKVMPSGARLFVLQTTFPGHAHQTRRTLGKYPAMSLADARAKAIKWYGLVKQGVDPSVEEAKTREAKHRADMLEKASSFAAVANEYFERGLRGQRWGARVRHQVERELIPAWGGKPIGEINRIDVVTLIEKIVDRPAPAYAHNIFQACRAVFNFAVERGVYGLEHSPCDRIKPIKLIGVKGHRTRVLNDDELRKLWAATKTLGYPHGALVRMLLLTGCRVSEVAGARWREFDLPGRTWRIPATRFKSNAEHAVPISDDLLTLLESLPRGQHGDLLFSTRGDKVKAKLDKLMGDDVPAFVLHDLRRTVRTRLSQLGVPEHIAEMTIGHARRGLGRIYDQHQYRDEVRSALDRWALLLKQIVAPSDDNVVVPLRRA